MDKNFQEVTELTGQMISHEQLQRMLNRYQWATNYIDNKDVLELACGAGQGLALLSKHARSVVGSDIDRQIVAKAQKNNPKNIIIEQFPAHEIPYNSGSFDVIILFEAIYYLPDLQKALTEVSRVLRDDGIILIATANPTLFDFTPSPYSVKYYSKKDLEKILSHYFTDLKFYGFIKLAQVSRRQKLLRPIKAAASKLGLMPRNMKSKEFLKRLFFGKLVEMPKNLGGEKSPYILPDELTKDDMCVDYKVFYCVATKRKS